MTNHEKWRFFTDGLISPDSFIDFGWFYIVAAHLQRRVWVGPKHKPLFVNPYTVLVSEPGIGKGLVITEVAKFLKHHKLEDPTEKKRIVEGNEAGDIVAVDRQVVEAAAISNYTSATHEETRGSIPGKKQQNYEKPLLIPVAADATTYEALVSAMSRSLRAKNYYEFDPRIGRNVIKIYTHSSLCFCLEELSSLFRKHSDDVANFLQVAYDCGDYTKDTKTQGKDKIFRCCLSLLAGTNPTFMRKTFSNGLLNEGFASRAWFIYAARNRKTELFIPELNEQQLQAREELLAHTKKLTELYGSVSYTPEAYAFMDDWWKRAQLSRANLNEKLIDYYSRKNIHAQKLAAAIHFSESTEMTIGIESCKKALWYLSKEEKSMHYALVSETNNPYSAVGLKIIKFLEESNKEHSTKDLLAHFWERLPTNDPRSALNKILEYYWTIGRVNVKTVAGISYYGLVREEKVIDVEPESTEITLRLPEPSGT